MIDMRKNLDVNLKEIIIALEKASKRSKKKYFKAIAKALDVPSRKNIVVNLSKLDKIAAKRENGVYVVCGKLLGGGNITKKVDVYAFKYSKLAAKKLEDAGMKIKTMRDLIKDTPRNVILLK